MATIKELETIDSIKKQKEKAKYDGKDVATVLSGGKDYFKKALDNVRTSAEVTIIMTAGLGLIATAVKVLEYVSKGQFYTIDYWFMAGEFLGILLVVAAPIALSIKLLMLDSTPRFVLGLLIVTLLFNLMFCSGIIPIIALIYNIIALVSWSTYKTWFYQFKR